MGIVVSAVLTIVLVAVLAVGGYALWRVVFARLRHPVLRLVDAAEFPPENVEILRPYADELKAEGFHFIALQHTERPRGDDGWAAVYCDAAGETWVLAQRFRSAFTRESHTNLVFYSRLPNSKVVVTTRENLAELHTPSWWALNQGDFGSVGAQQKVHREASTSYGEQNQPERFATYEEFREWRERDERREVDLLWDRELLSKTGSGQFRYQWGKIHLPLWAGLVEMGLYAKREARPFLLSAHSRILSGSRQAKERFAAWREQRARAKAAKSGAPLPLPPNHPAATPIPGSAPMPGVPAVAPSAASPVAAPPHDTAPLAPAAPPAPVQPMTAPPAPATVAVSPPNVASAGGQISTPSPVPPGVPGAPAGSAILPLPGGPGGQQVPGSRIEPGQLQQVAALQPAETHAPNRPEERRKVYPVIVPSPVPSPSAPKTRVELYRENADRPSLLRMVGWTLNGFLQCLTLVVLLNVLSWFGAMDPAAVAFIVAVLVLHEFGHLVAARLFGYRNRALYVLPFLGLIGLGRNRRVSPGRETMVYLMGPLPGLLLGWGVLLWNFFLPGRPEWMLEAAFWSVLLNTFFLLPFHPFDGGRLADLAFFNRHPHLRVAFYLFGGASLAALFVVSPWLLVVPAVVLAQLPGVIQAGRLSGTLRSVLRPGDDQEAALLKTFKVVEDTGHEGLYQKSSWSDVIDRLMRYGSPGAGGLRAFAGFSVHFVLLGLPIFLLLAYGISLRVEQVKGVNLANQRITTLQSQVAWGGTKVDEKTRQTLTQMMAAEDRLEEIWQNYGDIFDDEVFEEKQAESERLEQEVRNQQADLARTLNWEQVSTWIVEHEDEHDLRRGMVIDVVQALIDRARAGAELGDHATAERDLSMAYWALVSCEPRYSFVDWRHWSMMESQALVVLEELTSRGKLSPRRQAWFARALASGPRPEGRKMALLLLRDVSDGMVVSGDAYGTFDIYGWDEWDEHADNPIWHPDRELNLSEATEATRERMAELGVELGPGDEQPTLRVRLGNFTRMMVTSTLSGKHIPACLEVADHWASQAEATPSEERGAVVDDWNRRLRSVLRVCRYRELAAAALADELPREVAGSPLLIEQDATGRRLAVEVSNPGGQLNPLRFTWRLPPDGPAMGAN